MEADFYWTEETWCSLLQAPGWSDGTQRDSSHRYPPSVDILRWESHLSFNLQYFQTTTLLNHWRPSLEMSLYYGIYIIWPLSCLKNSFCLFQLTSFQRKYLILFSKYHHCQYWLSGVYKVLIIVHILCQLHIYYLRFILKKRGTPLFEQLINCKFLCLSEIIS